MVTERTLADRLAAIELLVLDVDGVLTDGGILYADDGTELKRFHVRDGSALKLWRSVGKRAAVISGRRSPVVERRAAELGLHPVIQGAEHKLEALAFILRATGLRPEQVCAVGDDLPDLPVLRHCGLAVAVADACREVRADAHHVTAAPGGRGAVREVVEWLLTAQGHWAGLVERLRNERPSGVLSTGY
jgi:3-deoxy-D-manno-octulosonate 8-phosphate phosphatase (KDO 8-P phosphatase)